VVVHVLFNESDKHGSGAKRLPLWDADYFRSISLSSPQITSGCPFSSQSISSSAKVRVWGAPVFRTSSFAHPILFRVRAHARAEL
jgi:hypothetical protein